jgi:urease accessory protein
MHMVSKHIPRVGIGGPVGSGKTALIERIVPLLSKRGYKVGIVSNDVVSREDAERMRKNLAREGGYLPEDLVIGLATGGCPHTAVREDPSMNISIVEEMESQHNYLNLILIESGGDNITTTFSPALADYSIYIIDVAGGDKYPRKRGLGIERCDLIVINKIDLAPYVGADLDIMQRDANALRGSRPYLLVNCKTGQGIEEVTDNLVRELLFESRPKAVASS